MQCLKLPQEAMPEKAATSVGLGAAQQGAHVGPYCFNCLSDRQPLNKGLQSYGSG